MPRNMICKNLAKCEKSCCKIVDLAKITTGIENLLLQAVAPRSKAERIYVKGETVVEAIEGLTAGASD